MTRLLILTGSLSAVLMLAGCATTPFAPNYASALREQQMQSLCTGNHTCNDYKAPVGEPQVAYLVPGASPKIPL